MKRAKRKFENELSTTATMLVGQLAVAHAASASYEDDSSSEDKSSRSSSPITAPGSPIFSEDDLLQDAFDRLNLVQEPARKRPRI